jgi:hypothetical protein
VIGESESAPTPVDLQTLPRIPPEGFFVVDGLIGGGRFQVPIVGRREKIGVGNQMRIMAGKGEQFRRIPSTLTTIPRYPTLGASLPSLEGESEFPPKRRTVI